MTSNCRVTVIAKFLEKPIVLDVTVEYERDPCDKNGITLEGMIVLHEMVYDGGIIEWKNDLEEFGMRLIAKGVVSRKQNWICDYIRKTINSPNGVYV